MAVVEASLASVQSAVENLSKSGEKAFYFVVGVIGVGVSLSRMSFVIV